MDPVYVTQTTIAVTKLYKIHYSIEVPKTKTHYWFSKYNRVLHHYSVTESHVIGSNRKWRQSRDQKWRHLLWCHFRLWRHFRTRDCRDFWSLPIMWLSVTLFLVASLPVAHLPQIMMAYTGPQNSQVLIKPLTCSCRNTHRVMMKNPIIFWKPIIRFGFGNLYTVMYFI